MSNFTYKPFYRFIYRYGNLLITPVLLLYMLPAVATFHFGIGQSLYLIILAVIIFYVNKLYFRLYKILPTEIAIEGNQIICSRFFMSNKKIVIGFSEIVKLQGGVFYGKSKGLMQIIGEKETVGFFHHLTGANIFITTLLQNVRSEVYSEVEPRLKERLGKNF